MKNTWKGMAVGAFTGAAIGILMDSVIRGGQAAADLGTSAKQQFQDKAPQAVDWAESKGHSVVDWARDQDLTDKAKHVADRLHSDN